MSVEKADRRAFCSSPVNGMERFYSRRPKLETCPWLTAVEASFSSDRYWRYYLPTFVFTLNTWIERKSPAFRMIQSSMGAQHESSRSSLDNWFSSFRRNEAKRPLFSLSSVRLISKSRCACVRERRIERMQLWQQHAVKSLSINIFSQRTIWQVRLSRAERENQCSHSDATGINHASICIWAFSC